MKVARFEAEGKVQYGVVQENQVKVIVGDLFTSVAETGQQYNLSDVRLLAPVEPGNVIAVGLNYVEHIKESTHDGPNVLIPKEPVLFFKPKNTLIGPEDAVVLPAISDHVEYEGELAVVIGKVCRNVSEADALSYVYGYTCANDISARDWQKKEKNWVFGKGCDTFLPMGPWIETELDSSDLQVQSLQNGVVKQNGQTSWMIFGVPTLISFISKAITLQPGDVIITGTPSGVGRIQAGDRLEVTVEGIGTLSNPVIAEA